MHEPAVSIKLLWHNCALALYAQNVPMLICPARVEWSVSNVWRHEAVTAIDCHVIVLAMQVTENVINDHSVTIGIK